MKITTNMTTGIISRMRAFKLISLVIGLFISGKSLHAQNEPPANDVWDQAAQIELAQQTNTRLARQVSGNTSLATPDSEQTANCEGGDGPGLWFRVMGNGERMTASTCTGTRYNTMISVFAYKDRLECIGANDNACSRGNLGSGLAWTSEEGVWQVILVHGPGPRDSGEFNLVITAEIPTVAEADADADGVPDRQDVCPGNDDRVDADGDGVPDGCDVCAGHNDNSDSDGDGVPNGCDICTGHDDNSDSDGDGVPNGCDICTGHDDNSDSDGDGVPNGCDACEGHDDSADEDGDGIPDACDGPNIIYVRAAGALGALELAGPGGIADLGLDGDVRLILPIVGDGNAAGGAPGTSWVTPHTDLQEAITDAVAGDEIWVAEGTYKPTDGSDRTISFELKDGVKIYGGFIGYETELEERNPQQNAATLSANIGNNSKYDNSYTVVKAIDCSSDTVLDGFIISGVTSWELPSQDPLIDLDGDGIGDFILQDQLPVAQLAEIVGEGGGAALLDRGIEIGENQNRWEDFNPGDAEQPVLCTLCPNETTGMYVEGGSPNINNCAFQLNEGLFAGALMVKDSSLVLRNCSFEQNKQNHPGGEAEFWAAAAGDFYPAGGAVSIQNSLTSNSPAFIGCDFYSNEAATYAGAINKTGINITGAVQGSLISDQLTLINCSFRGNSAALDGGAVSMFRGRLYATNCLFNSNAAGWQGGAINVVDSPDTRITNATIHGNHGSLIGGIRIHSTYEACQASTQINNSIFSQNTQNDDRRLAAGAGSSNLADNKRFACTDINHCVVVNDDLLQQTLGDIGIQNHRSSPFLQPNGPDGQLGTRDDIAANLNLPENSALMDGGSYDLLPADSWDIDDDGDVTEKLPLDLNGLPRKYDTVSVPRGPFRRRQDLIDLGAYEWHPDEDSDNLADVVDNCPSTSNPGQEDTDGDGVGDACDNCVELSNADQENDDGDALGNACDTCNGVVSADSADSDGDGHQNPCDPRRIEGNITPNGGQPGNVIEIKGLGLINIESNPRVEFNGVVADYDSTGFEVTGPGDDPEVTLYVIVPEQVAEDVTFVDVTVTNFLDGAEISETLPGGFAYTNQRLSVGQRVPIFGGDGSGLVATNWDEMVWHNPDTDSAMSSTGNRTNLYLVAQGDTAPTVTWETPDGDEYEVSYATSYPESSTGDNNTLRTLINIQEGESGGGDLPADLDYNGENYAIFNEEDYNTNEALGVIYEGAIYALNPTGVTPESTHVVLRYLPDGGVAADGDLELIAYAVEPGDAYAGVIGGQPTYQIDKNVGEEIGAFYPLNELIKCIFPLPEDLNSTVQNPLHIIAADMEFPIFTTIDRTQYWQNEAEKRIFVVNTHPNPSVEGRIFARWPIMSTIREVTQEGNEQVVNWVPVCANVVLDDTAYTTDYTIAWPDDSPVATISGVAGGPGVGAPLPEDLMEDREHGILDLQGKKENREKAFILDVAVEDEDDPEPLVFATNVRCGEYCEDEPSWQHVIVHYRTDTAEEELVLQVYDVDPGEIGAEENEGSYNPATGRMLLTGNDVGDLLEPIYPLDILVKRRNTTLPDRNIMLMGHTRIWKNPAGGRLSELYCVNASPGDMPEDGPIAESILISWPRITTKQDLEGRWREIDVYDTEPAEAPYVHEFVVAWDGPSWQAANAEEDDDGVGNRTTVIGRERGAPLPAHWQEQRFGEPFSIEKVRVFEAEYSGTGGNLNDEHALIYRDKEEELPDEGWAANWRLFALQPPYASFNDRFNPSRIADREGGEGWVLLQRTWDEGKVEFFSYKVETETDEYPLDKDPVAVGNRLLPYYPLDDILFGSRLTLPADLNISVVPDPEDDSGRLAGSSTGWWINDLRGALDPGVGSHIYAVNRGAPGELLQGQNPHTNPADSHITVRWRIPRNTLTAQDDVERKAYLQTFQVHWPDSDAFATDGIDNDGDGDIDENSAFTSDGIDNDGDGEIDEPGEGETAYSTVFIKGLADDGANRICLTPDDNPAGCDKVFYEARVFDGIGEAAITGGFPESQDANPNDEHALIYSGKLYAGRDDSLIHHPDSATRPWVLLGYQAEEGNSPLLLEPFKVERQDFARRYYLVGNMLQNPVPYLYLAGYPNSSETRIVTADQTPLAEFGWRDPNGDLWFNRKWPLGEWEVDEGPSAHFDFKEWWFPEGDDPETDAIEMLIGRNDHIDWIDVDKDDGTVDNIEIRSSWPTQPGIGPGYYTRLYVGEAINRSGHQAIEIIFNGNDGIDNDGDGEIDEADEAEPTDPDLEGAHIELLVQRERDACATDQAFCVKKSEGESGSAPPGYYKFVSAISQDVKALGDGRDHHWATIGTIDEVVSVETFKIQCPPVRGMIVPVGNKCAFSPSVKLRFWPLRNPPEDYGAEFLETGLYDEETIPEDLLESLYDGVEGITFSWSYMSATDFNNGLDNWLPYPDVDGPVLEISDASGIDLIMDRYYKVRYTGYDACRGEVPPRADTQLQVEVSVDGELQFDVNEDSQLRLSADQNTNGGQWNYLGSISAAASQNIAITFGGNDHEPEEQGEVPNLFADAVRIVQVERNGIELSGSEQDVTIIDNDDPAATSTGGAWTSIVSPGQYGNDAVYFNSTGATVPQSATFTWEYETPADDDGVYDIYVWWPEGAPGVVGGGTGTHGADYWYSPWTDAMLLPGWVKRIVQGMDLENFNLEAFQSEGDILVSALEIIGQRADDTIAFNCDPENLNELGLLDIYTNVLYYARNFSIGTGTVEGFDVEDANIALLLVASRIGQMLMMMGNEAYADALDPTIGSSIYEGSDLEPEKYFAFHNQFSNLLDEELALLRGRPKYQTTLDMTAPVFNRITWNWTSDLAKTIYTAAYRDAGIVTIEDAMQKFPQGHGDAWGHYIGASKVFYSLLSNPYFTWTNRDEDVLVAGRAVKVGFRYMRQFAEAAAARARAGRDIVALEFRKQYNANPEEQFTGQGYIDEHVDTELLRRNDEGLLIEFFDDDDEMRAWGLHDWATRAATSSYIDWAVVSSRLPAQSAQVGLKKVDRTTVKELDEIAANHREIVQQINIADSGLNPLGLAGTVVPFDLDANALQQNNLTHFEQTLQKATNAVGSAVAVLNFANQSQNRLREHQGRLEDFIHNTETEELRYQSRLIEVFGRPYPDDLAYPSNYDGPDFLHFDYIDLGALSEWNDEPVNEIDIPFLDFITVNEGQIVQDGNDRIEVDGSIIDRPSYNYVGFDVDADSQRDVTFHYSSETGFSTVPNTWSSPRPEEGQLQQSLRQIHISLGRLEQSRLALRDLVDGIEADVRFLEEMYELQGDRLRIQINDQRSIGTIENRIRAIRITLDIVNQLISSARGMARSVAEAIPTNLIVGLAAGGDMASVARGALMLSGEAVALVQFAVRTASSELQGLLQEQIADIRFVQSMRLAGIGDELGNLQTVQSLEAKIRTIPGTVLSANLAREELIQSVQAYKTQLGTALRLVQERDRFREKTLRDIRDYRHNSLTYRLFHNDAMQKYRAQFEMASRYAYLAAQTFDYETNLLGSGFHIGRFDDVEEALEKIIQARSPGAIIGQNPAGGSGLTGVLFELGTSFEALKSAIRIPQAATREFSLRRSLLQIPPAGAQNHEEWRTWLEERVVDLRDFPDIRRLAQLEETIAADDDPGDPGVIPEGLVIEFPTGIANTSNFFLNESLGGDPGFSPEHLATKILKCGVYFSNYPHGIGRLSPTPYVYLVPAGASVMRVPIGTEPGIPKPIREFQLVDQIIPPVLSTFLDTGSGLWRVPDGSELEDPAAGWRPGELLQGCIGRTCFIGDVRKINPFVAGNDSPAPGNPQRGARYAGLAGRTAWNTQWYLVIPGRNLGAQDNDPTLGLQWLINGQETGEGRGITDIILTIEAYSYENPF